MTVSRIKVRLPTKFPSNITGTSPIEVTSVGGAKVIGLDAPPFMIDFLENTNAGDARADLGFPGDTLGDPIVILCMGQSNFVQRPSYTWSPAANVLAWNWDDTDGTVGTAFVAVPGTTINMPERIASVVADLYPTRQVYVIGIAIGSQSIAHWMSGTGAPDMYENTVDNVVPALAAIGVSKIDEVYWWQGEDPSTTPETYVADFTTVMNRFRALSWFPASTPITIFSLAPTTISGDIYTDRQNAALQAVVRDEPDLRRFVYTGQLPAAAWADTHHPSGVGMHDMGRMGAEARHKGDPHQPLLNPVTHIQNNGSMGRPANRNLVRGGDFTVNPWRYGTTFTGAANGATVLDNWTYVSSGAGVVDVLKTADAPTVAQAGIFTQHCIHVDVTTADASIASSDYYGLQTTVSGLDASFLGLGQTGAKSLVISFWVKHTVTGNYFVAIENSAQNRSNPSQYTVYAADTWEKKYVVIAGDTSGTWLYTSGVGLRAFFTIASGDTYLFTPDVWTAGDVRVGNATRANGMSSSSNNFKLALVQIEEGLYPSAFDRQPTVLQTQSLIRQGSIGYFVSGVNVNSANTDYPIAIALPVGYTKYRVVRVLAYNPSISLTTATAGVFTAAAAGGTTIVTNVALSALTTNTAGTSGCLLAFTVINTNTTYFTDAILYFRVGTAQGSAATCDVYIEVNPIP